MISYLCIPVLERCLSGRKDQFAKLAYGLDCTEGSNPSLSANESKQENGIDRSKSQACLSFCADQGRISRSDILF